jgi:hypothetical protein
MIKWNGYIILDFTYIHLDCLSRSAKSGRGVASLETKPTAQMAVLWWNVCDDLTTNAV